MVNIFEKNLSIVHVAHPALVWEVETDTQFTENIPKAILGCQLSGKALLAYFYRRNMLFGGGTTFAARAHVLKQLQIPQAVDMFIDEYLVLHTLQYGDSFLINEALSVWRVHKKNFSGINLQQQDYASKIKRSLNSKEAVLKTVLESDFSKEIKSLCQIKFQVADLAMKESQNQKGFSSLVEINQKHLPISSIYTFDFEIIHNSKSKFAFSIDQSTQTNKNAEKVSK